VPRCGSHSLTPPQGALHAAPSSYRHALADSRPARQAPSTVPASSTSSSHRRPLLASTLAPCRTRSSRRSRKDKAVASSPSRPTSRSARRTCRSTRSPRPTRPPSAWSASRLTWALTVSPSSHHALLASECTAACERAQDRRTLTLLRLPPPSPQERPPERVSTPTCQPGNGCPPSSTSSPGSQRRRPSSCRCAPSPSSSSGRPTSRRGCARAGADPLHGSPARRTSTSCPTSASSTPSPSRRSTSCSRRSRPASCVGTPTWSTRPRSSRRRAS